MKTSIIASAALTGLATAGKSSYGSPSYYGSYPSSYYANCPFIPSGDQFVLFADNELFVEFGGAESGAGGWGSRAGDFQWGWEVSKSPTFAKTMTRPLCRAYH
jgi:hypothetical protein